MSLTVAETRAHLAHTQQSLLEATSRLNTQLQRHFPTLLSAVQEISCLHTELSAVDASFRDLCFQDDNFQIGKLPPAQLSPTVPPVAENKPQRQGTGTDTGTRALCVSRWTLAVSQFTEGFGRATGQDSALLQQLLLCTEQLATATLDTYTPLVTRRARSLQQHITGSLRAGTMQLSLAQHVSLYTAMHRAGPVQWDTETTAQYDTLLFDSLLEQHGVSVSAVVQGGGGTPEVQQFLRSAATRTAVVARLQRGIEAALRQLETGGVSESAETPTTVPADTPALVAHAQMQSRGLTTPGQVHSYRVVTEVVQQLHSLQVLGGDSYPHLRARLQEYLRGYLQRLGDDRIVTADDARGRGPVTTDDMVHGFVRAHDAASLRLLLRGQLHQLDADAAR